MLGTIERSGAVIDLFTADAPEWGVREVARILGLPKTNVHSILSSLAKIGLLERTSAARYRLGWRLLDMSNVLISASDFRPAAQVVMRRIAGRTPGAVGLFALERGEAMCIGAARSQLASGSTLCAVGTRLSAVASPAGRTLIADRPWREVRAMAIEAGVDPESLRTTLADVRERQWCGAESLSGFDGVAQVAVPLYDLADGTAATIAITAPSAELAPVRGRSVALLQDAAAIVHEVMRDRGAGRTQAAPLTPTRIGDPGRPLAAAV